MNDPKLIRTIRLVIELLVSKNYDGIETLTLSRRLTSQEMREVVQDYGVTLIFPPDGVLENPDVIEVRGATPRELDVRVGLWTLEEGQSDLTLEMTLTESENEIYDVQIDGIHVL